MTLASRGKRATPVSSASSDPQASRERRETEVCLAPRAQPVSRETTVSLVLLVLLALLDLQDCLVPQVLKEQRDLRVKLVPREKPVYLDPLVFLVLLVMSFSRCPCSPALSGLGGT